MKILLGIALQSRKEGDNRVTLSDRWFDTALKLMCELDPALAEAFDSMRDK